MTAVSSSGVIVPPAVIVIVLVIVYFLYYKWKQERDGRRRAEDEMNFKRLWDYAKEFRNEKGNQKKVGHFLGLCYFDRGIQYRLFVDENAKVKDVLEEAGILTEAAKVDWFVSDKGPNYIDFALLNDGFDWYLFQDQLYYATPGKPKKKRKGRRR